MLSAAGQQKYNEVRLSPGFELKFYRAGDTAAGFAVETTVDKKSPHENDAIFSGIKSCCTVVYYYNGRVIQEKLRNTEYGNRSVGQGNACRTRTVVL